ncbi:cytochrome P450 [Fibrella sp. HMF5335]|uniref:Cytochrome P450 n=1 Tax=Fibrella rubiginis TaxID=2817060 RepID=A0A939GFR1_9BACT|nr:cytochrome P450 [Fibrella rubiginis]MBO0938322.1 cytochrome P450 [Fibrella rubiginis]
METIVPVHPGLPLVGNTLAVARDPLGMFTRLHRQYGRVVRINIGGRNQYMVFQPEDVKYVLQENHRNYGRSPAFRVLKRFLGEGLLTSDGDFWRHQRRLAQPAFHRQKITLLASTMVQESAAWVAELGQSDLSGPINISQALMDVTMRIVCKTLFSTDASHRLNGLSHSLETLNVLANKSLLSPIKWPTSWPTPNNRRYAKARKQVDDLIYGFIASRKQTGTRHDDLLDMLLYAEDEEAGDSPNRRMPEQQLRDECVTLFTAGHETTAVSMAWTLYLLAHNPASLERLQAEVAGVLGTVKTEEGALPPVEAFRAMPYTLQVVQESMRLYPPAWAMSRMALADDHIGPYRIPKGDTVVVSPYLLHHDPTNWPDPERFDPDRFAPGADAGRPAYAYLPFGGGPRLCIGNQFALMEMQILLALLVQSFDIHLVDKKPVRPQPLITLRPSRPIRLQLTARPTAP